MHTYIQCILARMHWVKKALKLQISDKCTTFVLLYLSTYWSQGSPAKLHMIINFLISRDTFCNAEAV